VSLDGLRRRVRQAGTVAVVAFAVLGARLAWLQIGPGQAFAARALDNAIRVRRVTPPRGRILDRNGVVLAGTRATVALVVRPADVPDPVALRDALAPVLDAAAGERLDDAFASKGLERHRAWVVHRDLDEPAQAWLAARRHLLPGTDLQAGETRTYPVGAEAAHLVGYLSEVGPSDLLRLDSHRYRSGDEVGRSGLERALEPWLAGVPGRSGRVVDALGRPVHGTGPWADLLQVERRAEQAPAVPGAEVHLTLDERVQHAAVEALDGRPGAAVMLDVHTGAILAYASSPAFDPAELVHGIDRARWKELTDNQTRPLLDRVVRGLYPPASTFKMVTAVAALNAGVPADFTVDCNGGYQVGRRRFHCWKHSGHGKVDLITAITQSYDTWFYAVGLQIGPDVIADAARRLGLGPATGFALNDERSGIVPSPTTLENLYHQPWTIGDTASAAIGQGIDLVTPLQLAVVTATVANGGNRVTPWVVDRVVAPDGATMQVGGPLPTHSTGFDPKDLAEVRKGMEAVVMGEHGTARRSRIDGLAFAGKTGTAQVVSARVKHEHPGPATEDHALFVAFAPVDDPQVAVAVVLEHAGGGSHYAAPVAKQILTAWGQAQGILPEPEVAAAEGASK